MFSNIFEYVGLESVGVMLWSKISDSSFDSNALNFERIFPLTPTFQCLFQPSWNQLFTHLLIRVESTHFRIPNVKIEEIFNEFLLIFRTVIQQKNDSLIASISPKPSLSFLCKTGRFFVIFISEAAISQINNVRHKALSLKLR